MQPAPLIGLLEWSNAVRLSMASDPGRQLFHDQVNTHGFLFLQDYTDNILCKTKSESLIELVKTPGRKKVVSKKPKPASKLNNIISLSFEADTHEEKIAPVNAFHNALLTAKDVDRVNNLSPFQTRPTPSEPITGEEFEAMIVAPTANSTVTLAPADQNTFIESKAELLVPDHSDSNELSIIAEDDENVERSQISAHLGREYGTLETHLNTTASSSDAFHPITLDSPVSEKRKTPQSSLSAQSPSAHDVGQTNSSRPAPLSDSPLWDSPVASSGIIEECFPKARIALVQNTDADHDRDLGPMDTSPFDSKPSISTFPVLPAPMPLRKSMRAPRDPSVGMTTPGTTLGGRTSWLKKAREVKAMEGTAKNISASTSAGHSILPTSLHNTLKRKSGDALIISEVIGSESEERRPKSAKIIEGDTAPLKPRLLGTPLSEEITGNTVLHSPPLYPSIQHEGMLDRFKRTVEGLGARVGKSIGKPLGAGAAVSALAEARAAAEARVAERNHKEEQLMKIPGVLDSAIPTDDTTSTPADDEHSRTTPSGGLGQRLSISDLFPINDGKTKIPGKILENDFQNTLTTQPDPSVESKANRESITTTPPDSPPATRMSSLDFQTAPVFNKPPPVFIPPIPPVAIIEKGVTTHSSSSNQLNLLSVQSTLESIKQDSLFEDDVPTWLPTTQDTEFSTDSQSQEQSMHAPDEDDSWPVDGRLSEEVRWSFGVDIDKEDSMTWSTMPSQSQEANADLLDKGGAIARHGGQGTNTIPGSFDTGMGEEESQSNTTTRVSNNELKETLPTAGPVNSKPMRNEDPMTMASSVSSQSQPGFLGQASKLLSSALGTSKKGKPGVEKVLQMAAVAAKKQQEENDKKTARLKEMENRRQLAVQRKAEEEKVKSQDRERKLKEDGERRKREREETTEKRPLKVTSGFKKDDDNTKKRKITVEAERKPELKKPASKPVLKSSMKQPTALSSSAAYNASLQVVANSMTGPLEAKSSKSLTALQKGKTTVVKTPIPDDDLSQPSQLVQIQMAARAKAQIQAARQITEPSVQSESIELPDINSEYSDSEDEERPRTFDPPDWAQSPELRQALQVQSTINPDDIFGAIRPLKMEELFKTRTSRFRARTSSANWTGSDRLTAEEEREYVRRMGFR